MSEHLYLTKEQARNFLFFKHGLKGEKRYIGKEGVMEFINSVGCIQFDPIDVCGKNPELVLQSRVEGFKKEMLYELLYEDRRLLDHFDKSLAIYPVELWPYFRRVRDEFRERGLKHQETKGIAAEVLEIIKAKGFVSSSDIGFNNTIEWDWGNKSKLSRAILEVLYYQGDTIIHHKNGTRKYYALTDGLLEDTNFNHKDPFKDDHDFNKWRVLRRIEAIGLLWDKPSDAFLMIRNLKSKERIKIFHELHLEEKIIKVTVEGVKEPLYLSERDKAELEDSLKNNPLLERVEFLAPLDNLIWDRKLIKALYNFDYKWEIYTPAEQRKFGYYTLPVIRGNTFIGRIELLNQRKEKALLFKNIWLEEGISLDQDLCENLQVALERFKTFSDCKTLIDEKQILGNHINTGK
ncbi:MAG: winged helix DNA-binding domain-containing protein [Clostridiaceae bacterium]